MAAVGAASILWLVAPSASAQQPPPTGFSATIRVPGGAPTIQQAVDRVQSGGMVLIAPGVYEEQVVVTTPYVTIRGEDRNRTIVDGGGTRATAIEVDGANGVVIQNLTVRNALADGISWNGVDGFWGSFVTASDNGRYGIAATGSTHGQIDHAYASGNGDAGIAMVACNPCGTVITDVGATGNGAGYQGVNAGGDLTIINGEWYGNGAGIVSTTVDDVADAPQRGAVIAGNSVHDNGAGDDVGAGILVRGGRSNLVAQNLVEDSSTYGIALIPTAGSNLWVTADNAIRDNTVRRSGVADLALERQRRAATASRGTTRRPASRPPSRSCSHAKGCARSMRVDRSRRRSPRSLERHVAMRLRSMLPRRRRKSRCRATRSRLRRSSRSAARTCRSRSPSGPSARSRASRGPPLRRRSRSWASRSPPRGENC